MPVLSPVCSEDAASTRALAAKADNLATKSRWYAVCHSHVVDGCQTDFLRCADPRTWRFGICESR